MGDYECREDRVTPVMTKNSVPGGSISHALRHADEDLRVGKLVLDNFGSTEWSRLPANSRGGWVLRVGNMETFQGLPYS